MPKFEKPDNTFIRNPKKTAELFGEGRMTREEKAEYLNAHDRRFFRNIDFVNVDTYRSIFNQVVHPGDTIVNVGAGYSISPTPELVDSITRALQQSGEEVTLIPIDYSHDRTKSWLLLDTKEAEKDDLIHLEPVTASATDLPFGTASVDGYYSANLINEPRMDKPGSVFVKDMLTEAYRVLKPGGFFLVSSFGYVWWKLQNGLFIYNDNVDEEKMVTKEQIMEMLTEIGYTNIEEVPFDDKIIEEAAKERLARREDATEVGIQEACAFLAFKPQ